MNFIKLGSRYINLDLVTDVNCNGQARATVVMASSGSGESNAIDLYFEEAKALQKYLNQLSNDLILNLHPPSLVPDYEDWKRNEPAE